MNGALIAAITVSSVLLAGGRALAAPCASDDDCDVGYACVAPNGTPACVARPMIGPPPPPAPLPPPRVYESYGTEVATSDVIAVSVAGVGLTSMANGHWDSKVGAGLLVAGGSVYVLGAPAVHLAHGNPMGFASLGLRVLGPPAGAIAGAVVGVAAGLALDIMLALTGHYGNGGGNDPLTVGLAVGFFGGLAGATIAVPIVDSVAFARVRVDEPAPKPQAQTPISLAPYVVPAAGNKGGTAGLRLAF